MVFYIFLQNNQIANSSLKYYYLKKAFKGLNLMFGQKMNLSFCMNDKKIKTKKFVFDGDTAFDTDFNGD